MKNKRENHLLAPDSQDDCRTVRVAQSELVAVDRCSCGTLSVHLGPMTLRVRPEGLSAIVQTLGAALRANEHFAGDARLVLAHAKPTRGQS